MSIKKSATTVLLTLTLMAISVSLSWGQGAKGDVFLVTANEVDDQTSWAVNSALGWNYVRSLTKSREPADYAHYDVRCIVAIGGDSGPLLEEWRALFPDAPFTQVFGADRNRTAMLAGHAVRDTCPS